MVHPSKIFGKSTWISDHPIYTDWACAQGQLKGTFLPETSLQDIDKAIGIKVAKWSRTLKAMIYASKKKSLPETRQSHKKPLVSIDF